MINNVYYFPVLCILLPCVMFYWFLPLYFSPSPSTTESLDRCPAPGSQETHKRGQQVPLRYVTILLSNTMLYYSFYKLLYYCMEDSHHLLLLDFEFNVISRMWFSLIHQRVFKLKIIALKYLSSKYYSRSSRYTTDPLPLCCVTELTHVIINTGYIYTREREIMSAVIDLND